MKAISILTALLALAPLAAQAQVKASLVAADSSVQPGRSTTVALRLDHEPHWHTYWVNAGTGYPSSLTWNLPAGWKAGDIQWPTPIEILSPQGDVTGNGYDGVLYLPMALTAPADAKGEVTLKGSAKWLMCAEVCIPGSQDVSLTLPVSTDMPKRNAVVAGALAGMPMPRAQDGWSMSAMRAGKNVTLAVGGAGSITSAHFFSEDAYIAYDQPQTANAAGGKLTLTLPIAEDAEAGTERLAGVLAYKDEQGVYRGAKVNLPFDSGGAAAVATAAVAASSTRSGSGSAVSTGAASLSTGVLALAFLGGLILNLMPCVFPVIGIKIMGFVNEAGGDRRRVTLHGLIFTLGVLLSFWALAGLLTALRAGGDQLGWGFQLQSAPFVFVLTVVMLIFALSLGGVFEFGVRATGVGAGLQMRRGYGGSFFAGVLATVVATPCSAPFLAPALGAALALPVAQSFVVFTVIALGLSAPYLLLSLFPQVIKALPKPGRWMETFKQAMAFPLYATLAYLIWVLAGQTSESGLLSVLFGLTVIALSAWLYGRCVSPGTSPGRVRFGFVSALLLLAFGLHLGWPRGAKADDIVWEPWSAEKVAQLREEGRPIYVDFTARWCATCQANKKLVFSSDAVKDYFRGHDIALLKGDWTNSDPRITAELAKWNRAAVPFNLVYLPGAPDPKVLPEILTPSIVLNAFGP